MNFIENNFRENISEEFVPMHSGKIWKERYVIGCRVVGPNLSFVLRSFPRCCVRQVCVWYCSLGADGGVWIGEFASVDRHLNTSTFSCVLFVCRYFSSPLTVLQEGIFAGLWRLDMPVQNLGRFASMLLS